MNVNIGLSEFTFVKQRKELRIAKSNIGGVYPDSITVRSHHTGNEVKFVYDAEAAMRNEFWDGILAEYIPVQDIKNVASLIVFAEEF